MKTCKPDLQLSVGHHFRNSDPTTGGIIINELSI